MRPPIDEMFDDVAEPARAHAGQHAAHHRREPEHVGLEHRAHDVVLAFLDRAVVAPSRVVDEDVDAAEAGFGGADGAARARRRR